MGIKSTRVVSRELAIDRIKLIDRLAQEQNYQEIFDEGFDPENAGNLKAFVDGYIPLKNIEKWTNEMLGNKLDEPWFRESMFDNYLVDVEDLT